MSAHRRTETLLVDLGVEDYRSALLLQVGLAALRRAGRIPDVVLLVEHPACFTVGRSGGEDHILAGARRLSGAGIPVHGTDRGGAVTYHGPGQLVCYAIVDLRAYDRDVHAHARRLEEVLIRTAGEFGVLAFRDTDHPGVWCAEGKIGALGLAVRGWVTTHGVALNIDPCLDHYGLIVPCGIVGRPVTSLASVTGCEISRERVQKSFLRTYGEVFDTALRETSREALAHLAAGAGAGADTLIENGRRGKTACLSR